MDDTIDSMTVVVREMYDNISHATKIRQQKLVLCLLKKKTLDFLHYLWWLDKYLIYIWRAKSIDKDSSINCYRDIARLIALMLNGTTTHTLSGYNSPKKNNN